MLRIYFVQQWYALSDPRREDAVYEIESIRRFVELELGEDAIPDETTILKFRHLLERHDLTARMRDVINDILKARGWLLQGGTMVDATIIHAASSTKKRVRQRDPEIHSTKKGSRWYFGMKLPVGADVNSGYGAYGLGEVAHVSDVSQMPGLLREEDRAVLGDKGYVNNRYKRRAREAGIFWGVSLKGGRGRRLSGAHKRFNHKMSSVRARVEHIFRVIKRQLGYMKGRYKGLAKNAAQVFALIGLSHLYLARRKLMSP
jgi:IS5 family transposase